MSHPLGNGAAPSTAYGLRGTHWRACGFHTGADWAAPTGTPVYAVVDGDVRYRNYGSAFGLQLAVSPDGPGEWFYAHLSSRVPDGTRVKAGDLVGRVGSTGNSTGPHLHLEYHTEKQVWTCDVMRDPWPMIRLLDDTEPYPKPTSGKVYLSKLKFGQKDSDSVWYLQRALGMPQELWTGYYGPLTDEAVRSCQAKHVPPADPEGKSFVGAKQAEHLFGATNLTVVDDLPKDEAGEQPVTGQARVTTFNWPSRYDDGGDDADLAMWGVLSANSDVIALQEAWWLYNRILRERVSGWTFITARTSEGDVSGEVLAIRDAWGDVLASGSTVISPYTDVQPEAAGPTRHKEKHIVWADVRDKQGVTWYLGNVHLAPSKHLGGAIADLWKQQRDACIAWVGRQGDNCVLLGDFNCVTSDPDAQPFRTVAEPHSAASHGNRDIDWVLAKHGVGVSAVVASDNRGQSDHRPVSAALEPASVTTPSPEGLRGIDISDHQATLDVAAMDTDFVIVKATEGRGYTSPVWEQQAETTLDAGKLLGLYHFARNDLGGDTRAVDEADYFVDTVASKVGEAVLVLDWERAPLTDVAWAKTWLDRVYERTGVRALVYMSESVTRAADWSPVAADHFLWVAKYGSNTPGPGWAAPTVSEPSVDWDGGWLIWQYTSKGRLAGYDGDLDLNVAPIMDATDWEALASPEAPEPPPTPTPTLDERVTALEQAVADLSSRVANAGAALTV